MDTDDSPSSAKATRKRLLQFGLRELLLLVVLVAALAAFWQQYQQAERLRVVIHAYDLAQDRSGLSADTFRIYVKDIAEVGDHCVVRQVVIEFLDGAHIEWTNAYGCTASLTRPPYVRAGELMHVELTLLADLIGTNDPDNNLLRELDQLDSGTGSAGLSTVPEGKKLQDLVEIRIRPGVYKRGQTLELWKVNGQTRQLTVK
jgi:hypothetical protein